jgi:hypothetical protein
MRVERFAALPRRGTDGNNLAAFLLDHLGHAEVDDRVDAFQVDMDHLVPLFFRHFFDGKIFDVPDTGIGHENVETAKTSDALVNEFLVVGVTADVSFEGFHSRAVSTGFLLDLVRGIFCFVVIAAPIPRDPPVMRAALPASEIIPAPQRI